ncbi:hypothetical protein E3N88_24877 [Mikania micrantha]|uniref:Uncharacterized protein n=1 Tax=Mikania micrantha TaxID=192012 RepID=A0A5N6N346_9ASTR|nr:hypothetical protein E3N88_24877 [Mikania micrantha]
MLAGYKSTLLSPMSTQRFDLTCNTSFQRKESGRSQPVKPISTLSVDNNPIEARTSCCSLKHNVVEKRSKGLKRVFDDEQDESFRAKRTRGCNKFEEFGENEDNLRFWYPNNVISPDLRTSQWSFVNELADLGERGVGSSSHRQQVVKETSSGSGSRSGSSPESHQSLNLDQEQGGLNGVGAPNPNQSLDRIAIGSEAHDEEVGFELISLLLACLEAIGMKNIPAINHFISKLGELASPRGDSSITRLASYYTEALALRAARIWPNIFEISTPREVNQIEEDNGLALHFLGLIRSTNPSVVVVAEQESEHNDRVLEKRVTSSLKYYSAIFDCIDNVFPLQNSNRIKIEESFGREIRNIIACEGLERVERHVGFDQWWKSMTELGGFRNVEINEREFLQSQMILKMYHNPYGSNLFKVEKRQAYGGGVASGMTLTWSDQPLYTVSAWSPYDIAGTSSSHQQQQQS